MGGSEVILQLKDVVKQYPGVIASNHVSIDFCKGEVHALVGENGAGKSTLIKLISGAIKPTSGSILFQGQDLTTLSTNEVRKLGIEVVYQEFNLVPDLPVYENIFLGGFETEKKGLVVNRREMIRKSQELFDNLGIHIDSTSLVSELSVAYMQFVEIAKAISKNAKVLIMDEPTAVLTNKDVDILMDIVKKLRSQGVTVIYVSHRMEEIFLLSDRITVLRDGEKIETLETAQTDRKELIHHMVGREVNESYPERTNPIGEEILRVENLSGNGIADVNFSLHKGEILGFGGLVGAGRTETMEVLFGRFPKITGKTYIKGREVHIRNPRDAVKCGLAFVPEDRKTLGLILDKSILHNISIVSLDKNAKANGLLVDDAKMKELTAVQIKNMAIKTPSDEQEAGNLSGGNQQKVVLGKWLASDDAQIYIFDEPTRGIDVGAKHEIYLLMNKLVEQGKAIIMVSSEMEELLGMSDRLVIMSEHRQAGVLEKAEFDKNRVLDIASGDK
ncbi:MAG: sugar ABC transporter ATP-binding protein [Lachnospiraceae bacterium]|nr:sugar ABC transporter ATP-binding protein [Lachnospiraceae bacterium]